MDFLTLSNQTHLDNRSNDTQQLHSQGLDQLHKFQVHNFLKEDNFTLVGASSLQTLNVSTSIDY